MLIAFIRLAGKVGQFFFSALQRSPCAHTSEELYTADKTDMRIYSLSSVSHYVRLDLQGSRLLTDYCVLVCADQTDGTDMISLIILANDSVTSVEDQP